MKQYLTAEDYIREAQRNIRWKRARKIATAELELHIQDQRDALIAEGYAEDEALTAALQMMGDPEKIGQELDAVHRPKLNLPVITLTAAFLVIGFLVNLVTGASFPATKVIAIASGVTLAFILYWCDYTLMFRFPRLIYWFHLVITIVALAYESRNGLSLIGYSYTFYLLLLFPITPTAIAMHLSAQDSVLNLFYFTIYALIPVAVAVLITSVQAIALLLICDAVIAIFGVRKHWFDVTRLSLGITLCLVVTAGIVLFYTCYLLNIHFPSHEAADFVQDTLRSAMARGTMFGDSAFRLPDHIGQLIAADYPIAVLLLRYGYIPTGVLLAAFAALLGFLYKAAWKQKNDIGRLLSVIICAILTFQFVGAVFSNVGIIVNFSMCFPFIVSGGLFTTYNLVLIGIMLSITRNEDIVKDWIAYQSGGGLYV